MTIDRDGVYYTTNVDGFEVSSVTGTTRNVVLVAPNGKIQLSVSDKVFNPWSGPGLPRPELLLIAGKTVASNKVCEEYAVQLAGRNDWNGIIWAPHTLVELNGSSGTTVDGAIIAASIRVPGSGNIINYVSSLFGGGASIYLDQ